MLRILLVRHGQTDWNAVGRNQGTADIELDETGLRQSEQLAEALSEFEISAIYTSDLKRASSTAQAVAMRSSALVISEPLLRERGYGEWEGLTGEEIEATNRDGLVEYRRDPTLNAPPGGETGLDLFARAGYFLVKMLSEHESGSVVVVSHGGTIANLFAALLHASPSTANTFRIFNCSITELIIRDNRRRIIVRYNDISHLNPKPLDHTFAGSAAN
ncbi:MAG: histidine phosphatase family protein [Fimbriimonadales bacterium]